MTSNVSTTIRSTVLYYINAKIPRACLTQSLPYSFHFTSLLAAIVTAATAIAIAIAIF